MSFKDRLQPFFDHDVKKSILKVSEEMGVKSGDILQELWINSCYDVDLIKLKIEEHKLQIDFLNNKLQQVEKDRYDIYRITNNDERFLITRLKERLKNENSEIRKNDIFQETIKTYKNLLKIRVSRKILEKKMDNLDKDNLRTVTFSEKIINRLKRLKESITGNINSDNIEYNGALLYINKELDNSNQIDMDRLKEVMKDV